MNDEQARIVTAQVGPALPLLHYTDAEYPLYTGPLGVARLFIRRDRYLIEFTKYGRHHAFLSVDPEGKDCREWSLSFVSPEQALRECLGVYFHHADYDSDTLAHDLRQVIVEELNQLEGATTDE